MAEPTPAAAAATATAAGGGGDGQGFPTPPRRIRAKTTGSASTAPSAAAEQLPIPPPRSPGSIRSKPGPAAASAAETGGDAAASDAPAPPMRGAKLRRTPGDGSVRRPRPKPVRAAPAPPRSATMSSSTPSQHPSMRTTAPTTAPTVAAPEEDFTDIEKFGVLSSGGVDKYSRPVMVFSAAKLPRGEAKDWDKLLRYMKYIFDDIVEADYSIVYLHHGLSSQNKPSMNWMRKVYFSFDRKYKKNLKALYVVHATTFVKMILGLCRPFISAKFGKKITYINELSDLEQYLHVDQLDIPGVVKEHDENVVASRKQAAQSAAPAAPSAPQAVFGASLQEIESVDDRTGIPTMMSDATAYIRAHGLETVGIFRRSANAQTVRTVKLLFNEKKPVSFEDYSDVHLPAVLIKTFLRELREPLLTFELYDEILVLADIPIESRHIGAQACLSKLPERNLAVLQHLLEFCADVVGHSDVNMMSFSNMAIVFGPNLLWSREQTASLQGMSKINQITEYLFSNHEQVLPRP